MPSRCADMNDYQFIIGNSAHVQKVLNQWRHQYIIDILFMDTYTDTTYPTKVILLVNRREK